MPINIDGLTSGDGCSVSLPNNFLLAKRFMRGNIPSCLFQMPLLHLLHLSGNGFTGGIPILGNESGLTDINLQYNRLSGSIPYSIQSSTKLEIVDFSHNFLDGVLSNVNTNNVNFANYSIALAGTVIYYMLFVSTVSIFLFI